VNEHVAEVVHVDEGDGRIGPPESQVNRTQLFRGIGPRQENITKPSAASACCQRATSAGGSFTAWAIMLGPQKLCGLTSSSDSTFTSTASLAPTPGRPPRRALRFSTALRQGFVGLDENALGVGIGLRQHASTRTQNDHQSMMRWRLQPDDLQALGHPLGDLACAATAPLAASRGGATRHPPRRRRVVVDRWRRVGHGRQYIDPVSFPMREALFLTRLLGASPNLSIPTQCAVCHDWSGERICQACTHRFMRPCLDAIDARCVCQAACGNAARAWSTRRRKTAR